MITIINIYLINEQANKVFFAKKRLVDSVDILRKHTLIDIDKQNSLLLYRF